MGRGDRRQGRGRGGRKKGTEDGDTGRTEREEGTAGAREGQVGPRLEGRGGGDPVWLPSAPRRRTEPPSRGQGTGPG